MTAWGVPPVSAVLDTDAGQHRIIWDGDSILLADHDEADAVLNAFGSPSCACFAVTAGWSALGSDPRTLLALFDPPPSLAPGAQDLFEIERILLGESKSEPAPSSSRPPGDRRRHQVKDAFLATIPLLPSGFRTALLRTAVERLESTWEDALRRAETLTALQHVVLVALRRALPSAPLHDVTIQMHSSGSALTMSEGSSVTVSVGRTWLTEIAAQDKVADWWNRALKVL